jgi:MerR family transcriptional regulator, copper efflux regulator
MKTDVVSITAVSERLGVPISTLRYWEERGLVRASGRQGGRRCYAWPEIQRIMWIQTLQETGLLSLDQIAQVLRGRDDEQDWHDVLRARIRSIEDQIGRLERARANLEHLVTCPSDHPDRECEILRAEALARWEAAAVVAE